MAATRRDFLATAAAIVVAGRDGPPKKSSLGLLIYSYGQRAKAEPGFAEPLKFLKFAASRGTAGVQLPLGTTTAGGAKAIRAAADELGLFVEGIVAPPKVDVSADADRFAAELSTAAACGADVVRTVMLGGRRYEVFAKAGDWTAFAKSAARAIRIAEPLARRAKVRLGVENHKDFRSGEQVDFLKAAASEWVGACVDFGNNLALLEDPLAAATALAPFAVTAHVKDIGVERDDTGFCMAEVPLGNGTLDLAGIFAILKKANPTLRFSLEMITRDPLVIPCLTEKYWATMPGVPAPDLAKRLRDVNLRTPPFTKLSRIGDRSEADRLRIEDDNVRTSLDYVAMPR
jgi:sugar phosphate isomerase/epimerase